MQIIVCGLLIQNNKLHQIGFPIIYLCASRILIWILAIVGNDVQFGGATPTINNSRIKLCAENFTSQYFLIEKKIPTIFVSRCELVILWNLLTYSEVNPMYCNPCVLRMHLTTSTVWACAQQLFQLSTVDIPIENLKQIVHDHCLWLWRND